MINLYNNTWASIYPADFYYENTLASWRHILSAMIPHDLLIWRQVYNSYDKRKENWINAELKSCWINFLYENPILLIYDWIRLVIYDWHHRTRFAPKYWINNIPSLIYDVDFWSKHDKKNKENFLLDLDISIAEADISFLQKKRWVWYPNWLPLPDTCRTINQLKERYFWKLPLSIKSVINMTKSTFDKVVF